MIANCEPCLSCPFCHGTKMKLGSKKTGNKSRGHVRVTYSMRCKTCGARGPVISRENPTAAEIAELENQAKKMWNVR